MKVVLRIMICSSVLLAACKISGLVPTPSPEPTEVPTPSPEPSRTNTPDPLSQLPPVPEGFTRQAVPEMGLAVLVPDRWYYKHLTQQDVESFFISKEDIDISGRFITGLSVYRIPTGNMDPDELAQSITQSLATDTTMEPRIVFEIRQVDNGVGLPTIYSIRYQADYTETDYPPPENIVKIIYSFIIPDTDGRQIYMLIFESPQEDWNLEWPSHGEPMVRELTELIIALQRP